MRIAGPLLIAFALWYSPAQANEEIVAGLSQNRVAITADFSGSEIMIYGAVKRDAPPPGSAPLEVIVTVEGPSAPISVRRKERRAGIWVNTDEIQINRAPSFYAVASTGPMDRVLSQTEDLRHKITLFRAISAVGTKSKVEDAENFVDALIRIRSREDQFRVMEGSIQFTEQTLFRADIGLPANLTEGNYRVRLFLTRSGTVVDKIERRIFVRKEGLERILYNLSREQPLIYGILSLLIALAAGYGASAAFRLIRR